MKKTRWIASSALLLSVVLLVGCPANRVRDLEWAYNKAEWRVPEGSILTGIAAVWVDENGALDEASDDPGFGFEYVSADRQSKFYVDVHYNGTTWKSDLIPFDGTNAEALSPHVTDDFADYIESAILELETIPEEIDLETETKDMVVLVGRNPQDGSEDASVFFHEEDAQVTNWETGLNWPALFQGADAYVFIDTATNDVETNSWDLTLRRAERIARIAVGPNFFLAGIMGVWVDRDGEIGEIEDNPGWGFEFVSTDGLQKVPVTVGMDGSVSVLPAQTLTTPVTTALTPHTVDMLSDYIAAAVGAASSAGVLPATEDIFVMVGFNQIDGSEDAAVFFEPESDRHVDWATLNWIQILQNADAWVTMDIDTLNIENSSWTFVPSGK